VSLIFHIMWIIPGDVAIAMLGDGANPDTVAALRQHMGLNDPWYVQYGRWIGNRVSGSMLFEPHIPRRIELPDVLTGRSYAAVLLGGRFAPVGAERSIIPNVLNSLIMTSLTMTLCLSISLGAAGGVSNVDIDGNNTL
jgi:hypothetical protein